jgi:hypothetical protein
MYFDMKSNIFLYVTPCCLVDVIGVLDECGASILLIYPEVAGKMFF